MKGIHVLLVSLLIPLEIQAGSLRIGQWLPWNLLEEEIGSEENHLNYSGVIKNLSLSYQDIKPSVSSIKWELNGNMTSLSLSENNIQTSAVLSGEILLTNLGIDQKIVIESGGNEIQVLLKADCTPIKLTLNMVSLNLAASLTTNSNQIIPKLSDLNLNVNDFNISSFSCNGIGGLNKEITAQVKAMLQRPAFLSSYLFKWLSPQLANFWNSSFDRINQNLNGQIQIIALEPRSQGLLIHAELPLKSSREVYLPDLSQYTSDKPQLILSHEGFRALLSEQILASVPDDFDLQNIKAFSDLMKSRFQQYLVWPELRRFPASSPFPLVVGPEHELLTLQDQAQWKGSLRSNGTLKASIGGAQIDYINFGFVLNTTFSVSIMDSVLTVKTGQATFDFVYSFGALYQMLFNPNKRISVSIFKTALASVFSNQSIDASLPTLEIAGKEWKLQNWHQNQELITMDWEE